MSVPTLYLLSNDMSLMDRELVFRWLRGTYWAKDLRRDVFERTLENSLCVGTYRRADDGHLQQVGFGRVVTDRATFAWVCDVYVDVPHRGRGLARRMVANFVEHPELQTVRGFLLGTKDAQGVYTALGFKPLENPEYMLALKFPPGRWQDPTGR